jgi:hypothetical protein
VLNTANFRAVVIHLTDKLSASARSSVIGIECHPVEPVLALFLIVPQVDGIHVNSLIEPQQIHLRNVDAM